MQETWITTFTKKRFYPLKPVIADICIEDIAHVLATENRWGGHCPVPYYVTDHSLAVAALCRPENALYGLLHDAHEAYFRDIPRPIKQGLSMSAYRAASDFLQRAIHRAFGMPEYAPIEVSVVDNRMLMTESIAFDMPLSISDMEIQPYRNIHLQTDRPWRDSEKDFINAFCRLRNP